MSPFSKILLIIIILILAIALIHPVEEMTEYSKGGNVMIILIMFAALAAIGLVWKADPKVKPKKKKRW